MGLKLRGGMDISRLHELLLAMGKNVTVNEVERAAKTLEETWNADKQGYGIDCLNDVTIAVLLYRKWIRKADLVSLSFEGLGKTIIGKDTSVFYISDGDARLIKDVFPTAGAPSQLSGGAAASAAPPPAAAVLLAVVVVVVVVVFVVVVVLVAVVVWCW
eukprot:m.186992 g.186992  ORF g.186992 m.186992 type:complete len:159 (+) comp10012_c2_seq8:587-1063(+)